MAVPDFQTLMLPLLKLFEDGQEHSSSAVRDELADVFQLSPQERRELLPSGKQKRFDNRVGWARTYLGKAGLLENTKRGHYVITERGRDVLKENISRIDLNYLNRFQGVRDFRAGVSDNQESEQNETTSRTEAKREFTSSAETLGQTPLELLTSGYQQLNDELTEALLATIRQTSWQFFEQLVIDLLLAMGYGGSRQDAGEAFQTGSDGGIDGVIKEDRLGLNVIYVQAKRWDNVVGRPAVQGFVGSLVGQGANRGVMITTSDFTKGAVDYVERTSAAKVILVDGQRLAQLMIEHDVGVAEEDRFVIKKIDSDYFLEEN